MKAVPISIMHVASMLDDNTADESDYTFDLTPGGYIAISFDRKAPLEGNAGWRELRDAVMTRRPQMKRVSRTHLQSGKTTEGGFRYWLLVLFSDTCGVVAAAMRVISPEGDELVYTWLDGTDEAVEVEFAQ